MFAFHLRTKLRKVVGTSRIGVSRSVAFCGNVGAPWRMEYTVLGQGVNLAARCGPDSSGRPGRSLALEGVHLWRRSTQP